MLVLVGFIIVTICVLGGYVMSHGQIMALWQPYEFIIIFGGAVGAFVAGNPMSVVKGTLSGLMALPKGPTYTRQDYVDLLSLLHDIFNLMRKSGLLSLEAHIEDPSSSSIFSAYPRLMREKHLVEFITDCLRLIVGGSMEPHELEALLEAEVENHHAAAEAPAHAVAKMADALPGFGIVAAVLGIVITMSDLGDDTSKIGAHVAGALVGTFLGILLGYGFVGPLASAMEANAKEDGKAFECVKVALLSSLRGYNPKVAIEFARKVLSTEVRPSFQELEDHFKNARTGA